MESQRRSLAISTAPGSKVHAIKGVLDGVALQSVGRAVCGANISLFLQRTGQRHAGADDFVHHADGKRA